MLKTMFAGSVLAIALCGCSTTTEGDRAFRKFLVGYDGISCEEGRQESLIEGDTQEEAQTYYDGCMAERY